MLWKTRVPGSGWSSPVVAGGRVWVTAADQGPEATSRVLLRVLAFDAETGREVVNVEVFRIRDAGFINFKNSRASPTPIVDGDRVYVHYGADGTAALTTSGDDRLEEGVSVRVAARQRRIAGPVRRSADFQLRRLRPGIRRRARQADGEGAMENVTPPALEPGVFDPARDSSRRSGSGRSASERFARPRTIRSRARRSGA